MVLIINNNHPIEDLPSIFIKNTFKNIFKPFNHFTLPFKWLSDLDKEKSKILVQVLLGLLVAFPFVIFLLIMLSSSDMIFSNNVENFFLSLFKMINFNIVSKSIFGIFIGLYLFGFLCTVYFTKNETNSSDEKVIAKSSNGIILNVLLFSILFIYTIFVVIQFRYLFSGSSLPYGLTFSEYARRGFFELVFLSVLNIILILVATHFSNAKIKDDKKISNALTKSFSLYLCLITFILLISSFYRMWLYEGEYGFTILRLMVYGFLIFEAFVLIATFMYVLKPKFNIAFVYVTIGLCYYLTLNISNVDYIIAKRNVDRYFVSQKIDIDYLTSLSTDAAPQIARLATGNIKDSFLKEQAMKYFINIDDYYTNFVPRWQRYNLSVEKARNLLSKSVISE